ncbi:endonuclease/exonuclease/phosphatase family protein [Bifidobacterium platyrrhinorum]|uniref:endonuclease/exonuclease/phosphatase family protein n=1 Tax=Bifidobacterium platyrrhinorum TaxID=2661628 RepID=UPI00384FB3C5
MLGVFAAACAALSAIAVAARALPSAWQALPFVPILVSATPWFALLAVIALMGAIASRRFLVALVAVAAFAVNVWWQYPFFHPTTALTPAADAAVGQAHAVTGDAYARVMTCNVYKGHADARAIVDTVRDERVEVLALQETTDAFVSALEEAGIGDYLPYAKVSSSDGVYGNGLWSASPLISPSDDDVNSSASFMPGGTVAFAGGVKVRFVSVHTTAPVPGYWGRWRRSLDELAAMRAHTDTRYVFMGDFNATYDHAPFRGFLGDRFRDAARMGGHGFTFTWPADRGLLPPVFAGIDHVVVDRDVAAGRTETVRIPGTDHRALLATLGVA